MTFGIFIVYKYAEIITHFGDFVNREWEWPQIPIRGHAVDFVAVLPPKWK